MHTLHGEQVVEILIALHIALSPALAYNLFVYINRILTKLCR